MVTSSIFLVIMIFLLTYKGYNFNRYIKEKYPTIYFEEWGKVKGPFGFMMGDSFRYFRWLFQLQENNSGNLENRKREMKRLFLILLIPIILLLFCSIYLYFRFTFFT